MNVFSWISISAGVAFIGGQVIFAIVKIWYPANEPQAWHYFVIYQAVNGVVLLYNVFFLSRTPRVHNIAGKS